MVHGWAVGLPSGTSTDSYLIPDEGQRMTTPEANENQPVAETPAIVKLPEGYVPTNTEMVVRGAGMQIETKGKQLDT